MKMKNLLNSLTRVASAFVLMAGLSLSSFAQTSGGFNYQAAIDPVYTDVTIEWTIGTYNGSQTVTVTNGIIATVIGQGVDFTGLTDPTLEIKILDGTDVIATSSQVINAVPYADVAKNLAGNKLNLTDVITPNDAIVNVDATNSLNGNGYTSLLGGAIELDPTLLGFAAADAAVVGYEKGMDALGAVGARVYNITNPLLLEAFDITSGDDAIFAGFFRGNVVADGKIAANQLAAKSVATEQTYKTVDVDYTSQAGESFTSILGGSAPSTVVFDQADAAVIGYDKTFTSSPENGGLGVLGAKVYNVNDPVLQDAYGLAAGDDKVFAGFFVGDVAIAGKLAGHNALFMAMNDGSNPGYKTVDVDYVTPNAGFTSILGGSVSSPALPVFEAADASVVAYDKISTDLSSPQTGIAALGARVYNIDPTSKLYEAFGPLGFNTLFDGDGEGDLNDKVFAGFFVGDVAIKGNLVVDGRLEGTTAITLGTLHVYSTYADMVADIVPCSPEYPEGSIILAMIGGKLDIYVAVTIMGSDQWMVPGNSK